MPNQELMTLSGLKISASQKFTRNKRFLPNFEPFQKYENQDLYKHILTRSTNNYESNG